MVLFTLSKNDLYLMRICYLCSTYIQSCCQRSACLSKCDLVLSLTTPQTTLSLMRLSVRSPNSQVLHGLVSEVGHVLVYSFPRLLDSCVEHVPLPRDILSWDTMGIKFFSRTFCSFFLSPGLSKEKVL